MLTASRLHAYQMKGAEPEYRKVKRLLEKEKVSFKNRKLKVKKTGNTKEICPNQVYIEIRWAQKQLEDLCYRGLQIFQIGELTGDSVRLPVGHMQISGEERRFKLLDRTKAWRLGVGSRQTRASLSG